MKGAVRQVLLPALTLLLCAMLLFAGIGAAITGTMPVWRDSVGERICTEKITGLYLLEQSALQDDTLLIFGSSELRTTEISTHPANFFAGKRCGFQVDLIGRGSCQSLIHAIQIAASGECLQGKKVVLITSPQSYVPEGIAPDLFMANFSPQQYLALLKDETLSDGLKAAISGRVAELLEEYAAMPGAAGTDPAVRALAQSYAKPSVLFTARNFALAPYYKFSGMLWDLKDKMAARPLLEAGTDAAIKEEMRSIDWETQEQAAVLEAEQMTSGNDFGMLDDYYTTYIGTRLERQAGKDAGLSYTQSKEYGDLRLLLDVCREKGIEPLFIHVPLHGQWSDYTGFAADRRTEYYEHVRSIAQEYGVKLLDLTGFEYEPYFMCDTMHIGWKGWLAVDQALISYYYEQ